MATHYFVTQPVVLRPQPQPLPYSNLTALTLQSSTITFSPGEVSANIYYMLAQAYPESVARRDTPDLLEAVRQVRR